MIVFNQTKNLNSCVIPGFVPAGFVVPTYNQIKNKTAMQPSAYNQLTKSIIKILTKA